MVPKEYIVANKIDLQAIVSEYYAGLYRFGLSLAKNESEAADLTQEAFLILAKHEKQIREPERIKTWLFTTLRREFFRKIRTRKAHPEVEFQPEEHEISGIESDALRSIDGKTAVEALAQIAESYRNLGSSRWDGNVAAFPGQGTIETRYGNNFRGRYRA